MSDSSTPSSSSFDPSPPYSPSMRSSFHAKIPLLYGDPEKALSPQDRPSGLGTIGALGSWVFVSMRTSRRRFGSVLAVLGLVCAGVIWINGFPTDWAKVSPSKLLDSI